MKRGLILLTLLLFQFSLSFAQLKLKKTLPVNGTVVDSTKVGATGYASISTIYKSDSVYHKSTKSDENGNFTIPDLDLGKHLLVISHGSFDDHHQSLDIDNQSSSLIDLKKIVLKYRMNTL
ncbi:carboxypeptidase-like regulatory domain-containing protein [Pedobacter endophyticus]|uniref:Carboxypeptidase regulatory-like domain-containing protein n=1 Tax=Pedobacter endophyticus TaxID=2789740 RepID=A0A7S9L1N7_9SPHI|nr:carboxypeptidase regulatory-like domain-containing protein [Pedobacter endophyticus]